MTEFTAIHLKSGRTVIVLGIPEEITVLIEQEHQPVLHRFSPDHRGVMILTDQVESWEDCRPLQSKPKADGFYAALFPIAIVGIIVYTFLMAVGVIP